MSTAFLIRKRIFLLFFLPLIISGCTPAPIIVKPYITPELARIIQAYEKAVFSTREDPNNQWHHGRMGNMAVNIKKGNHVGLCYHWQWKVYTSIMKTVDNTRWRALGIAINEGSFYEHHAVLLYRPDQTKFEEILKKPYKTNVYVLDPWGSGKPLVYNLGGWLKLPVTLETPARLTRIKTQHPPWKKSQ